MCSPVFYCFIPKVKHEYLRYRAYICLSLSSPFSPSVIISQIWPLARYSCCYLGSLHPRNLFINFQEKTGSNKYSTSHIPTFKCETSMWHSNCNGSFIAIKSDYPNQNMLLRKWVSTEGRQAISMPPQTFLHEKLYAWLYQISFYR